MKGTYKSFDEATLSYTDNGAGFPVVFLHPTPLDGDYWRPLVAELDGIRAIIPDLRGHGASELGSNLPIGGFSRVPDAPVLTMQQLAADVMALLGHLQVQNAVFVGCSIGGYVMLELWRQAPKRMYGLTFICSKPQPDAEPGLAKRAENIARVRGEGVAGFLDTMSQTLTGPTAREKTPAVVPELRARMTLTAEAVVAVQAGLAARPDSVPTVITITVPVLSIAGGEDGSVSPAEMEAFSAAPGGCEAHVIADAGHFAAFEQPHTVARLLGRWLDQFRA
jgi:pimeloyl-ACP methyl ester carboxylesterase